MSLATTIKRQLVVVALILGIWLLLLIAFTGQLVFTAGLPWEQAFAISLRDWYPWAIFAPVVAWLALKFPLERKELALSIPVHVAACILVVLACEFITDPSSTPPAGPPPGTPGQFRFRGGQGPGQGFGPGQGPGPQGQDQNRSGPFNRPDSPNAPRTAPATPGPDFQPPNAPRRAEMENLPPNEPGFPMERRRPVFLNGLVMRAKFNLPIYWIIVSIVHALNFQRKSEERERKAIELESRLTATRLNALRTQLHPHFLFNTLNAISTLVHRDPKAADEMIVNLSELLRITLDTPDQEITLRRELELLDRYLDIQRVRFGDRLSVEKQIDPAALDALVPTFFLQPIVENAIRHGLEPNPQPGILRIQAEHIMDSLRVQVLDNGVGLKKQPPTEGLGLSNIRDRLRELHGGRARMELKNLSPKGCVTTVEMPFRRTQPVPAIAQAAAV